MSRTLGRLPDPLGVVLLATGLALAAFGIVKTAQWGWASTQLAVTLATSAALIGWFLVRCSRVANPLLDLSLFRSNNFRWANAGTLVYATGFNAMFLGNVLFLTSVWHYSIIRAGLAISVGPLIVATTAPFLGRLAGRIGQRRLLVPGGLVWASGGVYLLARATETPDYLGVYLPAVFMTGLGVALCLPQLSSAAVQGLPPDRFGSGSAVNQAVRNLGGTFGVSLVIAFTADLTPATALDGFHKVWTLLVASGVVVSLMSSQIHRSIPDAATDAPATIGVAPSALTEGRDRAPSGGAGTAARAIRRSVSVASDGVAAPGGTSHSFGSMWPRFLTTLNVPPSDRAMYMFMRTWCWPGHHLGRTARTLRDAGVVEGGDDVVLLAASRPR